MVSDKQGHFRIRGVVAGSHRVSAESKALGLMSKSASVAVHQGQILAGVQLVLELGATISGRVRDQNGGPVAGVRVSFALGTADFGDASTDILGQFTATGMSGGGPYAVAVRSPGEPRPLRAAGEQPFAPILLVDGASRVEGVELAVRIGDRSISGVVEDTQHVPVPDVLVHVVRTGDYWERFGMITGADGRFEVGELEEGLYRIHASTGGGPGARVEGVASGSRGVRITLEETGNIAGTLEGFRTKPTVTAWCNETTRPGEVTGSAFRISLLSPGRCDVRAEAAGEAASAEAEVRAGQTSKLTLRSDGTARVKGRVVSFVDRTPVEGLYCSTGAGPQVLTDAGGAFELQVPVGPESSVSCENMLAGGFMHARLNLDLAPGAEANVELVAFQMRIDAGSRGIEATLSESGAPTIETLVPGGAADRAGLRPGDVLEAVDGHPLTGVSGSDVMGLTASYRAGATLALTISRDGERLQLTLVPSALGPSE